MPSLEKKTKKPFCTSAATVGYLILGQVFHSCSLDSENAGTLSTTLLLSLTVVLLELNGTKYFNP